jgi:RNA 2',3'-cyclic 3'-phosphodiesterase
MRCFIALPLPPEARVALATAIAPLRGTHRELSWTGSEGYHLTLAFIGEIEEAAVSIAAASLASASGFGNIAFSFDGLGAFPPRGAMRVLFARMEDEGRSLALYRLVNEALEAAAMQAGIPPLNREWTGGGREFAPHITLARARSRTRPVPSPGLPRPFIEGSWTMGRCSLYKSLLRSSGPVYTELRGVDLSPI